MSANDPLIDFIQSIQPSDARQAVHATQQALREMNVRFSRQMLPLVRRTHPEALSVAQATLHRTILIDALRKLEAANAELIAMAEREQDQQRQLQTLATLHPEYEILRSYGLGHCAPAGGSHSTEG